MAKRNNEAKIKFTAETSQFTEQVKEADGTLRELRSELKLNASQMRTNGESVKALQKRQQLLAQELTASKSKTDALRQKLEKAKEIYGENSDEVRRLQIQLNNAESAEEAIKREIQETNKKLKEQKDVLGKVSEKAGKVGEKLTNAGKSMSAVSAGIAAVGAASIAAFNEVDEGADNAIKATGATGEAAAELEEAYKNVAGQIVGDFADIGSALGEVNTRFGYTGEKLETATVDFQRFAEITGMDATSAVQAVSRALNDSGIPLDEYDTLLDQLAKAGQAAGIDVTTLADSLSKNGSVMRGMGFDTEETIALLSQFELSGADSTTMLSGMKKAMATWAKEGKNGNEEFANFVEGIKNGSITSSDALEVFGTRAGPMLVDAIKSGKFEYNDMLKTVQDSKGTLDSTFEGTVDGGYEMELAMQNAKLALGEVGNTLATTLTPFVETATQKLQGFANWWSGLSEKTQKTILTIAGVVAAIGPVLILLGTLASSISKIATVINLLKASTIAQTVAQWAQNAAWLACPITWIILAIIAAVAAVIAIFVTLWKKSDAFRQFWINCWEGIKNAFKKVVDWIKTNWQAMLLFLVNPLAGIFKYCYDNFEGFRNTVNNVITKVKGFFVGLWNSVKSVFTNIKSTFAKVKDAIVQPFKTAIDKVKAFFANLKLKFPKIKMPHFKITGKFSLNPPSVPKLGIDWYAKGAIFTKPTIFNTPYGLKGVGDVRGGEAVLPIDKLQGYISGAIERSAQTVNLQALADSIEELANRPISMNINGRHFAQATAGDSDSVNGMRSRLLDRGLVLD